MKKNEKEVVLLTIKFAPPEKSDNICKCGRSKHSFHDQYSKTIAKEPWKNDFETTVLLTERK